MTDAIFRAGPPPTRPSPPTPPAAPGSDREPDAVDAGADPFVRHRTLGLTDWGAWRIFLRRWGISIGSLLGGLAALFVFRRGVPHVGWIVGYLLVLLLLFAVLTQTRARLLARGRRLVVVAADYTIQTLYHGLLLFVLPGYFASTTVDGITLPFFLLLTAVALVTTIDPWYRVLVHAHPRVGHAFFVFAIFAALNVALPLIGVPPGWALPGSALLAGLALTPAFVERTEGWGRALGRAAATGLATAALAWVALPAIPPAPLQLAGATLARAVANLEPVDQMGGVVSLGTLADWGGLVAYTPVVAPAGLRQPIVHRWRRDGREVTTVRLSTPVRGGRAAGFRTYSRKSDFSADAVGRWTVDVMTASGQLIGRVRFTVVP